MSCSFQTKLRTDVKSMAVVPMRQQLGRILHQHYTIDQESWEDSCCLKHNAIKTQDCRERRTPRHWTPTKRKSPQICALPYSTCRHLVNVQKSGSVFLDSRGNRSFSRPKRLWRPISNRTLLHLPHPCFLCSIWWHCQQKLKQQLRHWNNYLRPAVSTASKLQSKISTARHTSC